MDIHMDMYSAGYHIKQSLRGVSFLCIKHLKTKHVGRELNAVQGNIWHNSNVIIAEFSGNTYQKIKELKAEYNQKPREYYK